MQKQAIKDRRENIILFIGGVIVPAIIFISFYFRNQSIDANLKFTIAEIHDVYKSKGGITLYYNYEVLDIKYNDMYGGIRFYNMKQAEVGERFLVAYSSKDYKKSRLLPKYRVYKSTKVDSLISIAREEILNE